MADDDDGYRSLGQTVSDTRSQIDKGKKDRSDSGVRGGLKAAGSSLSASGDRMISDSRDEAASSVHAVQYKRGGKVRGKKRANRAVPIIAHENERVIPANKRKKVERLMKREGMALTNKKRGKKRRSERM